jgi:hypothetical protein
LINLVCGGGITVIVCLGVDITVEGNNPRPSSFSIGASPGSVLGTPASQLVTLGPDSFQITETIKNSRIVLGLQQKRSQVIALGAISLITRLS